VVVEEEDEDEEDDEEEEDEEAEESCGEELFLVVFLVVGALGGLGVEVGRRGLPKDDGGSGPVTGAGLGTQMLSLSLSKRARSSSSTSSSLPWNAMSSTTTGQGEESALLSLGSAHKGGERWSRTVAQVDNHFSKRSRSKVGMAISK
jgi:hypothetical protein